MDQELRDFLSMSMATLTTEINRLSAVVASQSTLIREIEIKSTTRVAELQKDIDDIRKDITDVKTEQKSLNDSQKFKWKTLSEQRDAERKEHDAELKAQFDKDEKQAVTNSKMETLNKLLWAIFIMVAGLVIGFIWQLLINGGVKGMIP